LQISLQYSAEILAEFIACTDSLAAEADINLNSGILRDVLMDAVIFRWKAGKQKAVETAINIVDNEEVDLSN
jgi:hypothetical protein